MKVFFDLEFTGLYQSSQIMSIGMISEDGKKFYAEINNYDQTGINQWIKDNVIANFCYNDKERYVPEKHMSLCASYACKESFLNVRTALNGWLGQFDDIEFISDVCHYDFVLLIDIICGHALSMPRNICAACYDINQDIARFHNISNTDAFNLSREDILSTNYVEVKGLKHNALYDAKVIRAIYNIVNKE